MGGTRTLDRQRRRQERHGTARGFVVVVVDAGVELDRGGMAVAGTCRVQRFGTAHGLGVNVSGRTAEVLRSVDRFETTARQRTIGRPARRQQIDDEQQERYVSSEAHCYHGRELGAPNAERPDRPQRYEK